MSLIDDFRKEFASKYKFTKLGPGQFDRWAGFDFIAKALLIKERKIVIVETGTLNSTHDWLGYGQATYLWDWIASKTGGGGFSIDIDPAKYALALPAAPNLRIVCQDSIEFLREYHEPEFIDLLYLDSYNWSPQLHVSSSLHHMGELAAIYDRLNSGCLIAVDDCHSDTEGKHIMVRDFFKNMLNQDPVFKGYITVWEKR